jgi:putative ABC transport system permease protein
MNFAAEIKLVITGLLSRKGRSFLTILGIVIGVAGVIIIIALGAGAQSLVLGQVTKLGTNLIGVLPGKSNETGPPAQVFGVQITTLTKEDADAMADKSRAPHITAVAPFVRGTATIVWGSQSVDTQFVAATANRPQVINTELDSGRFFDEREETGGANVMVLGWDVKDELFGDTNPIGQVVKIKNVPFQVIGVTKQQGTVAFQNMDDLVYIPLVIGQTQLLGIHYIQGINAKVDSADYVKSSIADVTQILKERHHIQSDNDIDFSVRDLADAVKLLTGITNALRLFLVAMAAISLVVGGIGIMNIMLVTVAERTREIGLRKAVGATRAAIRNQFLLESGTVTLLGGLFGIIIGVIVSYLVALGARYAGYDWAFVISPLAIVMAVGVSILTGVVFGFYPAFKAARLNPIEALRYE